MKAIAGILSILLALVAPAVAQDKLFTSADILKAEKEARLIPTRGQSLIVSNTRTSEGYVQKIRVANARTIGAGSSKTTLTANSSKQALKADVPRDPNGGGPQNLECVARATV